MRNTAIWIEFSRRRRLRPLAGISWRYQIGLLPEALVVKRGGRADQLSAQWGLDRFRIQALLKLLDDPELPAPEAQAAREVLARKCAIFAQGCEKRGKHTEAGVYRGWEDRRTAGSR